MPRASLRVAAILSAVAVAAGLGACGGSSKPSYCQNKTDLQNAIKGLGSVDIRQNGTSALKTQVDKVQSSAKALVSSAKSDFPSETQAISTSLTRLQTAISQLAASPSAQQVATLGVDVQGFVTAVENFGKAAASKC